MLYVLNTTEMFYFLSTEMSDDGWDSGGESKQAVNPYYSNPSNGSSATRGMRGRGFWGGGGGGQRQDRSDIDGRNWRDQGGNRNQNEGRGGRGNYRGRGGNQRGGNSGGFNRADNRDENDVIVITVDSSNIGRIIGKGGAKIRELENDSGATIKVGHFP